MEIKEVRMGEMFFFRLPNTGIEVDIPLIGYFPDNDAPDAGIDPHVNISLKVGDWLNQKDTVLAKTLDIIEANKTVNEKK